MTYASLIVAVESGEAGDAAVRQAVELAARFSAALTGVCTVAVPPLIGDDPFTGGAALTVLLSDYEATAEAELLTAERRFRALAEGLAVDWRGRIGWPAYVLIEHARLADLIVMPGRIPRPPYGRSNPVDIIMSAGRPVLIVPSSAGPALGRPALVAWKDTRESRRAVAGAVPLLKQASGVRLAQVCAGEDRGDAQAALVEVATFLARHGIEVDIEILSAEDAAAGNRLLDHAKETGCGLLVAGAYGHSRLREWVLGGVTRSLLDRSDLCLLLAH
ncbi:hypothetical protein ER13_03415 [Brevundimonas sp. EAKA]|nr:hypothetical protein ER13_03415 [Brevundimonas sp. EAKA]OGN45329.1 MAG: hypothetical protein A2795_14390 [Caulobacterales bacterium RIFCSPHIGHO2_01_FULL_67_30]OGN47231.1 MAG: hypothetical protein A2093_02145 [Caulobacterales bacterium GWE1_67_11]